MPASAFAPRRSVLLDARFTPLSIPGCVLWLAADKIANLAPNAAVTTWSDLSGGARDATQGTAAAKPLWKVSQINGLPAVVFDTVDDTMNGSAPFTTSLLYALFAVLKRDDTVADNEIVSNGVPFTNGYGLRTLTNNRAILYSAVNNLSDGLYTGGTWELWTAGRSGTTTSLRINGVGQTLTNSTNTPLAPATSYQLLTPATGCSLAEVIAYAVDLDLPTTQRVERYLGRKYGLAVL